MNVLTVQLLFSRVKGTFLEVFQRTHNSIVPSSKGVSFTVFSRRVRNFVGFLREVTEVRDEDGMSPLTILG